MLVLGLSAFEHGGAAAVVRDGRPVAAAQEERWSRQRRDPALPLRAARACLQLSGATSADLDLVAFHERPLRRFERVLATELAGFPRSGRSFARSMFTWLGDRLWIRGRIAGELGLDSARVRFCEHAAAQAAAAYLTSPFEEAAVLFAGRAGEWAATAMFSGRGSELRPLGEQHHPHSLAEFCAAAVSYLGFAPEDAPRTLSELALHGAPCRLDELRELLSVESDGSVRVAPGALPRIGAQGASGFGPAFEALLGPARAAGGALHLGEPDARHADLAASAQAVIEEALLALAAELARRAGGDALCLAGEMADSPSAAARLLADGPFARLHLEPAPAAGGAALGAALLAAGGPCAGAGVDLLLGEPVLDLDETGERLDGEPARREALLAPLLAGGCAGWVRGRFAFGDPSPGDRVALADPASAAAVARLRDGVLRAEAHHPLGVALTSERAAELLELPAGAESPLASGRLRVAARPELRERAPAAADAGGGARPLVVARERDPELHALLDSFEQRSGTPALLCETLAARGEPAVRGALDARALLERSALDLVLVEDRLYRRA